MEKEAPERVTPELKPLLDAPRCCVLFLWSSADPVDLVGEMDQHQASACLRCLLTPATAYLCLRFAGSSKLTGRLAAACCLGLLVSDTGPYVVAVVKAAVDVIQANSEIAAGGGEVVAAVRASLPPARR